MGSNWDNRGTFTVLMGCEGSGKSAWRRDNASQMPDLLLDYDAVADGMGGWETPEARRRSAILLDGELERALRERRNAGVECGYSNEWGRERVAAARQLGYRIQGFYLGTASPNINVSRIEQRVRHKTGHPVKIHQIADQYRQSLRNLEETVELFDELTIMDNSGEESGQVPDAKTEAVLTNGVITYQSSELEGWSARWLARVAQRMGERTPRTRRPAADRADIVPMPARADACPHGPEAEAPGERASEDP